MKVLVAYMSQTGNTKKVAEAIYGAIPEPKEIRRCEDVTSLDGYDLSFLGFPIHGYGPDKKARAFLETRVKDRAIALFITHMAPEGAPLLQEWIQKFRDATVGANIIGIFDCQGQVSRLIKTFMRLSTRSKERKWARLDNSQGQPDATRLERARTFANEIMNGLKT
ncbi:MAG: flavodoxin family protein [Candidatus Bathyarchaeia archaeon]|jgi:flavodoxin